MEVLFAEIAEQLNATYEKERYRVGGTIGSYLPISTHFLSMDYKGVGIDAKYEFGNHNLAEIKFSLDNLPSFPKISVEVRDHLSRLFSFNKKIWKVKVADKVVEQKILALLDTSGLSAIAHKTAFEPRLQGAPEDGAYVVETRYYLGFVDKEKSIVPVLLFHQELIDCLIGG